MTEHQQLNETEEQRDNRRWWILLLLLLLLALLGLLCSSQFAIITGFDKSISARVVSDKIAAYKLNDEALLVEIGRLDPAIIQEATQDAKIYHPRPSVTGTITAIGQVIVLLPGTATPTSAAIKASATNTPRPTFTHTPSSGPPVTQPTPTATTTKSAPTPPSQASNTPTPSPATAAVSSATPTSTLPAPTPTPIPPTATGALAAPTQTPAPTSGPPTSTNTPAPPTPTNTPAPPTPTNTPAPPTPTNTPAPPTPTNTPVTPFPTPVPVGVQIEPDHTGNANPGATPIAIAYGHVITNTGSTTDTFTLTVSSSQGFSISVSPSSITLDSGANGPVTVRVNIPGTAAAGITDVTTVRATSANDPSIFDIATDTTQVNAVAGAIIQPDNSGAANPGDLVQYTHIVTNLGNITDTFTITLRSNLGFSVSAPASLTLPQGESAQVQISISVPATGYANITDTTTVSATSANDPATFDTAVNTTFISAPITTSFTLSAADGDQLVSLGWLAPATPVSQTIQYAINNASWQPLTTTLGSADRYYHNTSVTNGETYYYQVKAFYGGGTIRYSTVASATPGSIANRTTVACTSAMSVTVENSGSYTPAGCAAALNGVDAPGINPPTSLREGTVTIGDPSRPGELILDYASNGGIVDGPGYDVVFFELINLITPTQPYVGLEYTILDVSESNSGPWTTVFAWDGVLGHITNTNVYSYAIPPPPIEPEGEIIPPSILHPDPGASPPPQNTGIAIDISPYAPAGIKYRYIRLAQPAAGSSGAQVQVDAVYRLN